MPGLPLLAVTCPPYIGFVSLSRRCPGGSIISQVPFTALRMGGPAAKARIRCDHPDHTDCLQCAQGRPSGPSPPGSLESLFHAWVAHTQSGGSPPTWGGGGSP